MHFDVIMAFIVLIIKCVFEEIIIIIKNSQILQNPMTVSRCFVHPAWLIMKMYENRIHIWN